MRIGSNFQANISQMVQSHVYDNTPFKAILVWSPINESHEAKFDYFIDIARTKYNYTQEQALGMLFWHHYNIDKALSDLANFAPMPDDWSIEDRVLFEQAFSFLGKNFYRIHNMLPDKSVGNLVKYYYSWKKTRNHVSHIDKQIKKQSCNTGETNKNDEFNSTAVSYKNVQHNDDILKLGKNGLIHKDNRTLKVHMDEHDLSIIARGQGESLIKHLNNELFTLKKKINVNKQLICSLKFQTKDGIENMKPPNGSKSINPKWTNNELLLAVQGIREYGKDFTAIAELLGNKNTHLVQNFYHNYKNRYDLENVLIEHEKEKAFKENLNDHHMMEVNPYTPATIKKLRLEQVNLQNFETKINSPPILKQGNKSNFLNSSLVHYDNTINKNMPPVL